jgi:hypothetical protein
MFKYERKSWHCNGTSEASRLSQTFHILWCRHRDLLQDIIATIHVLLVEDYSWHAITSFASTHHIGFRQSASVKSILNWFRMKFLVGWSCGCRVFDEATEGGILPATFGSNCFTAQNEGENVAYSLLLIQSLCTSRFPRFPIISVSRSWTRWLSSPNQRVCFHA